MDGLSLIIGGMLGILAGWAFSSASAKQREASNRMSRANKAREEMDEKKQSAKSNREKSSIEAIQSFFLYVLGFVIVFLLGVILFNSVG